MPKDELDGFEIKFSAITKEMAFYLVNVFNSMSDKSLTPSDIAFDIYVTRGDNTPLYVYLHVLLSRILLLQKDIVILW